MMSTPSKIELMRYADGEMPPAERHAVSRVLEQDPDARALVDMFRWTALKVREAISAIDFEHVPLRLRRVLLGAPKVVELPRRKPRIGVIVQLAACLAVVCLAAVWGSTLLDRPNSTDWTKPMLSLGPIEATSALGRALNELTQKQGVDIGHFRLFGVAMFEDKFGNQCQEVDVFQPARQHVPHAVVVVCRGTQGWDLVGAIHTAPALNVANPQYAGDGAQAHAAIAGVLTMLGAQGRTTLAEDRMMPTHTGGETEKK